MVEVLVRLLLNLTPPGTQLYHIPISSLAIQEPLIEWQTEGDDSPVVCQGSVSVQPHPIAGAPEAVLLLRVKNTGQVNYELLL